ncbi:MAG: M6 family metalloprotease domain-containing protein, partial [Fidelibacterota bacterium]
MKQIRATIIFLAIIFAAGQAVWGTMPPHPRYKEQLAQGLIAKPYFLEHIDELRSRGVSTPWAAPAVQRDRSIQATAAVRSVGPDEPPTGAYKALVILVDFSDQVSQVAAAEFDTLIFDPAPGTLWDYYQDVSYGTLDIVTVNLPSTIGWIRADSAYSYYVDGQNGFGDYPRNAQRLAEDVVNAANSLVDFSQYDNDGDTFVDALFIVHTGPGAEYTWSDYDIWSHAWVTNSDILLDGVYVRHYSMEPEYWQAPGDMTIGVYAHEMGHAVFGLPDLYDYDEYPDDSFGLGAWSLMAGGSWNWVEFDG